jgi:hypothetical protein
MKRKILSYRVGTFEGEKRIDDYKQPSDIGTKPIPEFLKRRYYFKDEVNVDEVIGIGVTNDY